MCTNRIELNPNEAAAVAAGSNDTPVEPIGMPTPMQEDIKDKIIKPYDLPCTGPSLGEALNAVLKFFFL